MRSPPADQTYPMRVGTDRGDRVILTSSYLEAATSLTRMPSLESRAGSFVGFEPGLDRFLRFIGRSARAECGMESDVARQSARFSYLSAGGGSDSYFVDRSASYCRRLWVDGFG